LASCSSLKELYLVGNKISEVYGLHRLLKLKVLDLCHIQFFYTKESNILAIFLSHHLHIKKYVYW
jgi:hypothetical protein